MKKQLWIPLLGLLWAALACTFSAPEETTLQETMAGEGSHTPTPAAQSILSQGAPGTQTALPAQSANTRTPTPSARCEVNTAALNVRACAGLGCAPVAWLYAGDVATILPTPHPADWLPIAGGWVAARFCEVQHGR